MYKLTLLIFLLSVACGEESSDSEENAAIESPTVADIEGYWKLSKIENNGEVINFQGAVATDFKGDLSYVTVYEQFEIEGDACSYAESGTFELSEDSESIISATQKEIGQHQCLSGDFNPYTNTFKVWEDRMVVTFDSMELEYTKVADVSLEYEEVAEEFEKTTLEVTDPDLSSDINFIYRSPRQPTAKYACSRMAGDPLETSGFEISATYFVNEDIYDMYLSWDEGELDPAGYNGRAPYFSFEKRTASTSDVAGTIGTGRYSCSTTDCEDRCDLEIKTYDLIEQKAHLVVTCSDLPANSEDDPDNLFGVSLSNFTLDIECNYRPNLID